MTTTTSNSNRRYLGLGIAAALIVVALAWYMTRSNQPMNSGGGSKEWFTTDDGKTWFADLNSNVPPFQKDGKTAYGCAVMTADDGKSQWVAYLFRFKQPATSRTAGNQPMPPDLQRKASMEVKRPGDARWVNISDPRGVEIITPSLRSGQTGFVPLLP